MKSLVAAVLLWFGNMVCAAPLPLVDARIHYSHDAWSVLSPELAEDIDYRNAETLLQHAGE